MARIELCKKFRFEAAHWLPYFPEGHKCRRLHGHSFVLEVHLAGPVEEATGVVMDFAEVKRIVAPVVESLDHQCINHVGDHLQAPLLQNPTSENLCRWFYQALQPNMPLLTHLVLQETCTSSCLYRG